MHIFVLICQVFTIHLYLQPVPFKSEYGIENEKNFNKKGPLTTVNLSS